MAGLFVQKHVEAVRAQGVDVQVLSAFTWREFIRSWRLFRILKRTWGLPDVVQLNVIHKQGLLALWLKWRYKIPFIIVEHWSGYLPENGQFMRLSAIKRKIYGKIASEAETILPVSERLKEAMQKCGIKCARWEKINNVVDDFFFADTKAQNNVSTDSHNAGKPKTLLHVSCFDEKAKNVKGLLRAIKMLSERKQGWQLVLVGSGVDYNEVRAYAQTLDLPEGVLRWTGELTPRQVAQEMQKADAFVLSSRYETYGIILAEAAAAGLPILSTPVGIAEDVAALIVPQEVAQNKPGKFAEFIETILWPPKDKNLKTGLQNKDAFRAGTIGRQLKDTYDNCLHNDI